MGTAIINPYYTYLVRLRTNSVEEALATNQFFWPPIFKIRIFLSILKWRPGRHPVDASHRQTSPWAHAGIPA
jgi:hypothetical protein